MCLLHTTISKDDSYIDPIISTQLFWKGITTLTLIEIPQLIDTSEFETNTLSVLNKIYFVK
uniref:Uncharacterized protein n=1 Tax=Heterorhabditis bacteriophora TaxID=37862 RepID=A0A1I7WIG4_HETBA